MAESLKTNKTRWHRLLGTLLEQLLTPVGISVQCDVKVMVNPPEADILLLRRQTSQWTKAQLERLADGIRDTKASHILLEFKYSESVNEKALQQTLSYDYFYKSANKLSDKQVQSFLVSAKTPHSATLEKLFYQCSQHNGVYVSKLPVFRHVILIVLNELSNEPHNVWIKCFASRRLEKEKAFEIMKTTGLNIISKPLERLLSGLWRLWFNDTEGFEMSSELTPEKVMEMGKFWGESYLHSLTPEERASGLSIKERLAGLGVKERLLDLDTKEILSEIDHQKLLADLPVEEIEAFLQQLKKQQ
ncbi:MAG: hypothetical protein GQ569_03280 [Methylococcaceae bacterium]|nr:hypothetical protein [Methylococcaceae bacterium]